MKEKKILLLIFGYGMIMLGLGEILIIFQFIYLYPNWILLSKETRNILWLMQFMAINLSICFLSLILRKKFKELNSKND